MDKRFFVFIEIINGTILMFRIVSADDILSAGVGYSLTQADIEAKVVVRRGIVRVCLFGPTDQASAQAFCDGLNFAKAIKANANATELSKLLRA